MSTATRTPTPRHRTADPARIHGACQTHRIAAPSPATTPPPRPAPTSVMGPANRAPGLPIMGCDAGPGLDVMGGPDAGGRLNVIGAPDPGPRLDVMGESDLGFVDSLFGSDR